MVFERKRRGNRNGTRYGVIDLSNASDVYGRSDTVQPPAVVVNYIIKAKNSLPEDVSGRLCAL